MPEGKAGMDYLTRRGLTPETQERFRLGYAPSGRDALKTALTRAGIDAETAAGAGLVRKSERDGREFAYFRERVIFPILGRRGQVVAFGGRTLGDGQPKYLNSPESSLFEKRRVLYGLAQALPTARKDRTCIVVEGYMDVIALHQAGFDTAVAPLGTALTEEQLQILWKIAPEPILCFDGDIAGQKAAGRVAERVLPLLKPGFGVRFALLPSGEDPDSLIKSRGRRAMEDVLAETLPLSEMLWRSAAFGHALTKPEDRAALLGRLNEYSSAITDPILRSQFGQSFRDRVWSLTKRSTQKDHTASPSKGEDLEIGRGPNIPESQRAEKILVAIMIRRPDLFEYVGEQFGGMAFRDSLLDGLRQTILDILDSESDIDAENLSERLGERGQAALVDGLFRDPIVRAFRAIRQEAQVDDIMALWNEKCAERQAESLDSERNRVKEAGNRRFLGRRMGTRTIASPGRSGRAGAALIVVRPVSGRGETQGALKEFACFA